MSRENSQQFPYRYCDYGSGGDSNDVIKMQKVKYIYLKYQLNIKKEIPYLYHAMTLMEKKKENRNSKYNISLNFLVFQIYISVGNRVDTYIRNNS